MAEHRWRIEIAPRQEPPAAVHRAGDQEITLRSSRLYYLRGAAGAAEVQDISARLLCDAVVEDYRCEPLPGPGAQRAAGSAAPACAGVQAAAASGAAREGMAREGIAREGMAREGMAREGIAREGAAREGTAGKGAAGPAGGCFLEILPKPGVMDPAALSVLRAIAQLGYSVEEARTGRCWYPQPDPGPQALLELAALALANPLIEEIHCRRPGEPGPDPFVRPVEAAFEVRRIPLRGLSDTALAELSRRAHLFLSIDEMKALRDHYGGLDRDPTDIELETFAQTWSEHCVHKTFKSRVRYRGAGFPEIISWLPAPAPAAAAAAVGRSGVGAGPIHRTEPGSAAVLGMPMGTAGPSFEKAGPIEKTYDNLLADTIARATRQLNRPWCWSVFVDNAGVIQFDEDYGVAFKVETHNHPSALEPYGGAATGVGGCIRDILGCGLGARPIANTNVFCFAHPDLAEDRVPAGLFHPARSMAEVVRGVRDYGNRMGIPTVNGAIVFDDRYLGNPLVFCGCAGLIPRNRIAKQPRAGEHIVVIGGRTGRDGIHGATFSSAAMTDQHAAEFGHAVQIGNAITEKKVMDVLLAARDHAAGPLYSAVTDCGAGGLSSAVGEMAAGLGARVDLERVPLKYAGLRYDEIWISEAQERMVLAVPEAHLRTLIDLCAAEDVEATAIGTFTSDGVLRLFHAGRPVGEIDLAFLHHGLPQRERLAEWPPPEGPAAANGPDAPRSAGDLRSLLLERLAEPNVASKEWVIRQYDHEVLAGSVIKPLMGPGRGPTDGAVVRPRLDSRRGVVLSCGLAPHLSDVDPYVMAVAAVDEAVRNNIAVGGRMEHMALLDNFCWGDVSTTHGLGELVRAAQGCHDAAMAYGLPFISGKDSLNNIFRMDPADAEAFGWPPVLIIPGTLLISALSVIADVHRCRSSDLKNPGNRVVLAGPRGRTLGDLAAASRAVDGLLDGANVRSCHDVSDGGLAVTAAEMVIGSRHGLDLDADRAAAVLGGVGMFDLCLGTYLLEIDGAQPIQPPPADLVWIEVGTVIREPELRLSLPGEQVCWSRQELASAWRRTFDWP